MKWCHNFKKFIPFAILFLILLNTCFSIAKNFSETSKEKQQRMAWWTEARFGLFIHWGLYSLPARHEKVIRNEKMSIENYEAYMDYFNPDLYNPQEWAQQAKAAGMKYAVITTKHHDGFCLWDTKETDFKVTNTPYQKDLIREFVDAFREEGIKVGFYYSIIDWHHPHFTVDDRHVLREQENREALNKNRDMSQYRLYMKKQLRELLTQYGKISSLFMDYAYPHLKDGKGRDEFGSKELLAIIRELQPNIIINDRMDLLDVDGGWDYRTPEQFMPKDWVVHEGKKVPWETCQTFSGSWGYYRDEYTWKSTLQCLVMLIETVSKGGNLLLNVGPTARGNFDDRAVDRLSGIGEWMKYQERAIYGCTQAPVQFLTPKNCLLTFNPNLNRLYVHVLEWPFKKLHLEGFKSRVKYAQLLHDASEIQFDQSKGAWMDDKLADDVLTLLLPVKEPDITVPVIELFLD